MPGKFGTITGGAAALGAALLAVGAATAQADRPMLALMQLEPGLWDLRAPGNGRIGPRSICLGDPAVLIQLEHRRITCSQVVVTNDPKTLTVHYVCPFNGFGQTMLRVETPRLIKIDTQGIVNNAPFAYRAEARRIGPCPPQVPARR